MYIACLVNIFLLSSKVVLELLPKNHPVGLNWHINIKNRCKCALKANQALSNTIKQTQLRGEFDLVRPGLPGSGISTYLVDHCFISPHCSKMFFIISQ